MAAAESGIAGKRELSLGRKYANTVIRRWVSRPQEKRCLAQVSPISECRHLRFGQAIGGHNNGQRIAAQRLGGEHVYLTKFKFSHALSAHLRILMT